MVSTTVQGKKLILALLLIDGICQKHWNDFTIGGNANPFKANLHGEWELKYKASSDKASSW